MLSTPQRVFGVQQINTDGGTPYPLMWFLAEGVWESLEQSLELSRPDRQTDAQIGM